MNPKDEETLDPLAQLDAFGVKLCAEQATRNAERGLMRESAHRAGVATGFIAGFAARHYFRPSEFGIEDDMLETIQARLPLIARALESLLEGDDEDGLAVNVSTMFDPSPAEHEDNEDNNPE